MKPMNYIPLGRLISDVLIESGLVDYLIYLNLMEDVIVDVGKPLKCKEYEKHGINWQGQSQTLHTYIFGSSEGS